MGVVFKIAAIVFLISFLNCGSPNNIQSASYGETSSQESNNSDSKLRLVHTLYLKLSPGVADELKRQFIIDFSQLEKLNLVESVVIGIPFDSGDSRLYKDYDLAAVLVFRDGKNLDLYQKHPDHIALRKKYSNIFAKAPLVFDFIAEN